MTDQRGGVTIKTGKIGRCNILRQQIMMPGEVINSRITGRIMLESLRERETLRINAHLAAFLTPLRWIEPNWSDYLKAGPAGAVSIASTTSLNLARLGIGAAFISALPHQTFWLNSALRVYNEWYKWPEDADATTWNDDGEKAVPLQAAFSRARYTASPTASADYTVGSATNFDVRNLAEIQARFRSAMERDVLSYNRYMELVREMYNADGSREVDQVPIMVDQVELGVNPREIPAQDSAGLGQWQSLYDFGVDHSMRGIACPEHAILTYVLTIRFAPVIEGRHPLATNWNNWQTNVGDVEILKNTAPVAVTRRDVQAVTSTTALGYLPAGWQWRMGFDVVGSRVDTADSFPYMDNATTQAAAKDATLIKDAFRSAALGDYLCDLYISEESRNMLGTSLESYFSGMTGGGSKAVLPKQGKML